VLRRVASNVVTQVVSQALAFADRFILVGLLVRTWGADTYGDWVVLAATAGLLSLGELGLGIYFGNSWQQAQAIGDQPRFARLVRVSLFCYGVIVFALGTFVAVFAAVGAPQNLLSEGGLAPADAVVVFVFLACTQLSAIMRGSISQIYRGRGEFARGTLLSASALASYIVFAVIAVSLGAEPVVLAGLYFLCDLFGAGLILRDVKKRYADLTLLPARPTIAECAQIASRAKWNILLQGTPVALLHIPVLMLGQAWASGTVVVGFVLLRTLANYLKSTATLISLSAIVEIVPILHRGEKDKLRNLLGISGRAMSGIAGALGVGVLMLGNGFLGLWSGNKELFDLATMSVLVAGSVISASSGPLFFLFMLANNSVPAALASLLQLALTLVICVILVPSHGAMGVAIGLLVGEAVASWLVLPIVARRYFGVDPWGYLRQSLLAVVLSATWCGFVLAVALHLVGSQSLPGFLACAAVFGLLGFIPSTLANLPPALRGRVLRLALESAKRLLLRAPTA